MKLSRREFCLATGGALASACRADRAAKDAGAADDLALADGASVLDAGVGDDLTPAAADRDGCAAIAGGPAAAVGVGQAVFAPGGAFYICHDGQGLYGMSARCTHENCYLDFNAGSSFSCPCHESTFDFNGNVIMGPALTPLDHYALCIDSDGNIYLDPATVVDPQKRY